LPEQFFCTSFGASQGRAEEGEMVDMEEVAGTVEVECHHVPVYKD